MLSVTNSLIALLLIDTETKLKKCSIAERPRLIGITIIHPRIIESTALKLYQKSKTIFYFLRICSTRFNEHGISRSKLLNETIN